MYRQPKTGPKRNRTGFYGITKLRKTLRRIDSESVEEIKDSFKAGAQRISNDASAGAFAQGIYDTGDMIASIEANMGRDGLTAVIGPGAKAVKISKSPFNTTLYVTDKSKESAWNFFKGYWAEFGTKGGKRSRGLFRRSVKIPPKEARPFMGPAFDMNRRRIKEETFDRIGDVINEAAAGDGSDKP